MQLVSGRCWGLVFEHRGIVSIGLLACSVLPLAGSIVVFDRARMLGEMMWLPIELDMERGSLENKKRI